MTAMRVVGVVLLLCAAAGGQNVTRNDEFRLDRAAIMASKAGRGDLPQTTLYSYKQNLREGVRFEIAAEVAERIRKAGTKLHATNPRFTPQQWREVLRLRPDSVAADHYSELLER